MQVWTVRGAWLVATIVALGLLAIVIPDGFEEFRTVCAEPMACADRQHLTPNDVLALQQAGLSLDAYAWLNLAVVVAFFVAHIAVAGLLVARRPRDRMAVFVALMLVTFSLGTSGVLERAALHQPAWTWAAMLGRLVGDALLFVFLYIFPDGRFVPRWTFAVAVLAIAADVPASFLPQSAFSYQAWPPLLNVLFFVAVVGTGIFAQIFRFRRVSSAVQHQQTKWAVFGLCLALGGFLVVLGLQATVAESTVGGIVWSELHSAAFFLVFLVIPISLGIAVLRFRLYDIDPIIQRTVLYGALTLAVVGLYIGVVVYLGALLHTADNLLVSLAATGAVAVLFQPLRQRLQRGINRLLYGQRDEPYAALSELGRRLEGTLAPESVLQTIVQTVAQAMRLPYAALALPRGDRLVLAAAYGQPANECVRWPLRYQTESVGELVLAPRGPGEKFSPTDSRLLDDLARQAGIAAHAIRLTVELQSSLRELRHSRERLVLAQEEERRRVQRDLHDGLGPILASMRLRLGACLELTQTGPLETLAAELEYVDGLVGQATADIRRLVHDLRPPVLDQLGLVPALHQHVERFGRESGISTDIDFQMNLALSAAAEVGVFRVAHEALVNVQKHARAGRVAVRFGQHNGWVELTIRDDGVGLDPNQEVETRGTGLRGMRERADLLSGHLEVEAPPEGGTRIRLRIPAPLDEDP